MLTIPATIRKALILRLILAWPLLSLVIGAAVYAIEIRQVDRMVRDLAIRESSPFTQDTLDYLNSKEPEHQRLLLERSAEHIRAGHFVAVTLYNGAGQKTVAVTRPGVEAAAKDHGQHLLAPSPGAQYTTFYLDGRLAVSVLVPLRNGAGKLTGHFEGVYQADQETMTAIQERFISSMIQVVVLILATTVALYPIIMALNRDLIRLSVDLSRANIGMLQVLGSAIAKRDSDTNVHNYRVTLYAIRFAEALGLPAEVIRSLIKGAFLHDVGKIGISDTILLKPGALTPDERLIMQAHPRHGEEIIGRYAWLGDALDVVQCHHERFDGSGYPSRLKGAEIPLPARLFAIVDVFDALTSRRPYKEPLPMDTTMEIINRERGSHFDPHLVDVFAGIAGDLFAAIGSVSDTAIESELEVVVGRYFNI
ncbi:MAG: HD-GYP domain-containing protein, partial [Thermodesulfobacteriota bacterium]